jgi:hypothetical protein
MAKQVMQHADGIAAERACVIPSLAEAELKVANGRTVDRKLGVMPGRGSPIHRRHRLTLRIAGMILVVAPAVTQIDAPDESNVSCGPSCVANDYKLLVVGAAEPDTLVKKDLAPSRVQLFPEVTVLRGAEAQPVQVGPPEQPFDDYAAACGGGEDGFNLGVRIVAQTLVRIAAPVGEIQLIAVTELADRL